jgi:UDP-N-acetylglucosamine--dolichyl-phosphate N-acetylglucosaminephosphotransferase
MLLEILLSAIAAGIVTLISGRFIIPLLIRAGLVAQDINKKKRPMLPTSGGFLIIVGLFAGIMSIIAAFNYIVKADINPEILLLGLSAIMIISLIGFIDDISGGGVRTSKADIKRIAKNYSLFNKGVRQWQKPLLTLIGVIPLMVFFFGSSVYVPGIGNIIINPIIYIVILIPLAVIFASNSYNMLEGLNGIAVQMGIVAFAAFSIMAYHMQNYNGLTLSVIMFASLLGYLYYGKYPAKIIPGDSLTYLIGGAFAAVAIIGNMQLFAVILLVPWIIEFILKARKKFHASSWGIIQNNGRLQSPYGRKIYSLTHIFLRTGRYKEWEISLFLTFIEVFVAAISLAVFWSI